MVARAEGEKPITAANEIVAADHSVMAMVQRNWTGGIEAVRVSFSRNMIQNGGASHYAGSDLAY